MRVRRVLTTGLALAGAVALARRLLEERRHPHPFSPAEAWLLETPAARKAARSLIDHFDLWPGLRVLDAGCGPGRITIPAAAQVAPGEIVAMDVQQEMLDKVDAKAREHGLDNVRTLHGGLGEGVLTDRDAFDRILVVTVIGEIEPERRHAAFQEAFSALKPGGQLAVVESFTDPHFQSRTTVRMLAEAAGFRVKRDYRDGLGYTMMLGKPE